MIERKRRQDYAAVCLKMKLNRLFETLGYVSTARSGSERLPVSPVHSRPARLCAKQSPEICPVRHFLGRRVGDNRHCAV
jgi:hypothetical protein